MATRYSNAFTMPVGVGSSNALSTTRLREGSMYVRLYSANWTGTLKVKAKMDSEAYHDAHTSVFTAGGSLILPLPHPWAAVQIEVTVNTSGTIPTAIIAGWRE